MTAVATPVEQAGEIRSESSGLLAMVESRWFVLAATVLCALPMLLAPILPLVDIGGHIGRYAIQLDAGRTPELAQWYSFRWSLLPNLGVDLLVQLFGPLIGVEPAARVAVVLTVMLHASGLLVLSRKLHGRITPWAILALPLIYSFPFNFGFVNFSLSLALALWAMIAWIHFDDEPPLRRWVLFAAIAMVVWTCHLVGWATFCIFAGSQELTRRWQEPGSRLAVLAKTSAALSCLMIPVAAGIVFGPASGESGPTQGWLQIGWKLLLLMNVMLDRWALFDQISLSVLLTMLIWARMAPHTTANRGMILATAIVALCALLMPGQVLGSHYADIRLFPIVLNFALLAVNFAPEMPRRTAIGLFTISVAFALVRLIGNFTAAQLTGRELERELTVLDELPKHSQMVVLHARDCNFTLEIRVDRTTHLGGYGIARRGAFSNDQWQLVGAQLLTVHNPALAPFESDPSAFTFNRPCGPDIGVAAMAQKVPEAADYLWVVWKGERTPLPGWHQIRQGNETILYRRHE